MYGIKITGSFNGGTHTAVFTRIYWVGTFLRKGSRSRRRSPLSATLTSPRTVGSHPSPLSKDFIMVFFLDGTRFNTKTKSATFFSSANFVPSRKKLKIRLWIEFESTFFKMAYPIKSNKHCRTSTADMACYLMILRIFCIRLSHSAL